MNYKEVIISIARELNPPSSTENVFGVFPI